MASSATTYLLLVRFSLEKTSTALSRLIQGLLLLAGRRWSQCWCWWASAHGYTVTRWTWLRNRDLETESFLQVTCPSWICLRFTVVHSFLFIRHISRVLACLRWRQCSAALRWWLEIARAYLKWWVTPVFWLIPSIYRLLRQDWHRCWIIQNSERNCASKDLKEPGLLTGNEQQNLRWKSISAHFMRKNDPKSGI